MQIILLRNYMPDKQESMKRFADMLELGFKNSGVTVYNWVPSIVFGKFTKNTINGFGKWLGYIDKWIIFPVILFFRSKKYTRSSDTYFHICDHSNAPYLKYLPYEKAGITCHDVLAIRGALGFEDAFCPASSFGKILQKWILKNLSKAKYIVCVSQLTYNQLTNLLPAVNLLSKQWTVIHNAFNADFERMPEAESKNLLIEKGINIKMPFILHVGSNLERKNRKMLINMLEELGSNCHGNICFAGQPPDDKLLKQAEDAGLQNRIIAFAKPDHHTLIALYSLCEAFIFPSFSEGFGWPVIEAQACGAPVVASNIEPMPEVSGNAALLEDPYDPKAFAKALLSLNDKGLKNKLVSEGFRNAKRFSLDAVIEKYIKLYDPQS